MTRSVIVICTITVIAVATLTACQANESQAAAATTSSFGGNIELADGSQIHISISGSFPEGEDRGCDYYVVEPLDVEYSSSGGRDADLLIYGDLTCGS